MEEIKYSDGISAEDRIVRFLKESDTLGSLDLPAVAFEDWPMEYHLCPERSNLLRPFEWSGMDVLELGAGMGAVSRFLAENAKHLTVVEGTQKRFDALTERLRDLSNWQGHVGNIQDAKLDKKFDVVCVIGVLEYSELYLAGETPFEDFLNVAKSFLKEDGVLVLAIENRLGLKYLNGISEDHLATLFEGVAGYSRQRTPKTFSRKELKDLLAKVGLAYIDEFFPYPDYKIPSAVLSAEMLSRFPIPAAEVACCRLARDYTQVRTQTLFPEVLATDNFAKAGLLADVANSFLFVASKNDSPLKQRLLSRKNRGEVGWYYSNRRKIPVQTVFSDENRTLTVTKIPLRDQNFSEALSTGELSWSPKVRGDWVAPTKFVTHWYRRGYFEGSLSAMSLLERYLSWAFERWDREGMISGEALDAIVGNAACLPDGSFETFDLEWKLDRPLSRSWFVLRNLAALAPHASMLAGSPHRNLEAVYIHLCEKFGLVANFEQDIASEAALQQAGTGKYSLAFYVQGLSSLFKHPLPEKFPRKPSDLRGGITLRQLVAKAKQELRRYPFLVELKRRSSMAISEIRQAKKSLSHGRLQNVEAPSSALQKYEIAPPFGGYPKKWAYLKFDLSTPPGERSGAELQVLSGGNLFSAKLWREGRPGVHQVVKFSHPVERIWLSIEDLGLPRISGFRFRSISKAEAYVRLFLTQLGNIFSDGDKVSAWLREGKDYWKQGKLEGLRNWLLHTAKAAPVTSFGEYDAWVQRWDSLSPEDIVGIERHIQQLLNPPSISVFLSLKNADPDLLPRTIDSVRSQLYPHWELCLSDDESQEPLVENYRAIDPRIKTGFPSGDYVTFLKANDELAPHALYHLAIEITKHPDTDLIYADEDRLDDDGRRLDPRFNTSWNRTLFLAGNLSVTFCAVRRGLFERIDIQDNLANFVLQCLDEVGDARFRHLPFVLYHSRSPNTPIPSRELIESFLKKKRVEATVAEGFSSLNRIRYPLPQPLPKVSAIICTRDRAELLKELVDGLLLDTDYENLEILIVDNQSKERRTLEYFEEISKDPRVQVLKYDRSFNFSAMNNLAATESTGDILALLNNDLKVIHSDWLKEMVSFAVRPEVGAVGAKLLYPNGTVQHGGVITGVGGVAGLAHRGIGRNQDGFMKRAQSTQYLSAVTGACLVVRKHLYQDIGGMDENALPVAFNDVDFCLKLREKGLHILWTPHAELYHFESATRGSDIAKKNIERFRREIDFMQTRWGKVLEEDPFYNPNLSLEDADFSLAFPPRVEKPWREFLNESPPSEPQQPTPK